MANQNPAIIVVYDFKHGKEYTSMKQYFNQSNVNQESRAAINSVLQQKLSGASKRRIFQTAICIYNNLTDILMKPSPEQKRKDTLACSIEADFVKNAAEKFYDKFPAAFSAEECKP